MNNQILAELEYLLTVKFHPTFLALTISPEDGTIEVVMSAYSFNSMTISERTISVFNTIDRHMPATLTEHLIVLQCFSTNQIDDILDDLYQQQLKDGI